MNYENKLTEFVFRNILFREFSFKSIFSKKIIFILYITEIFKIRSQDGSKKNVTNAMKEL